MSSNKHHTFTQGISTPRILVESALMVAIATVLSMIRMVDLPYGGSVTIGCMLPVIVISYRHGPRWGVLTGFVFGILQQLLGLRVLTYVTTWQSIVAVILLDYIVAYAVTGLGGIFRMKRKMSQPSAFLAGTLFVCVLRYICHVISGATVWAGLSIPSRAALLYSFGYNATYMIPETIVTAILAYYISSMVDFRSEQIIPFHKSTSSARIMCDWIGGLCLASAAILDALLVFSRLQNAETGEFDITGLGGVNWPLIGIITVAGVAVFLILQLAGKKKSQEQ